MFRIVNQSVTMDYVPDSTSWHGKVRERTYIVKDLLYVYYGVPAGNDIMLIRQICDHEKIHQTSNGGFSASLILSVAERTIINSLHISCSLYTYSTEKNLFNKTELYSSTVQDI
jgi:hypothetical protein